MKNIEGLDDERPFDWCSDVCMLTKGMSVMCERKKPCPKYTLKEEDNGAVCNKL
jgi:hypothetical protein